MTSPTLTTSNPRSSEGLARFLTRTASCGVAQLLLAVQLAGAGLLQLTGQPVMTRMFDTIGGGDGLRLLVGAIEVAGAVGLLIPCLAGLAALGLVALLVGAIITNVAVLQTSPWLPLALLVVAALVAYGRRHSTRRLLTQLTRRHL